MDKGYRCVTHITKVFVKTQFYFSSDACMVSAHCEVAATFIVALMY